MRPIGGRRDAARTDAARGHQAASGLSSRRTRKVTTIAVRIRKIQLPAVASTDGTG